MIGNRQITFDAVLWQGYWQIVFSEEWYDHDNEEWHSTIDATGSGNQFEVAAMIMTCLKMLLKKNPQNIRFSAKSGGARAAVYRKLAGKLLADYERSEEDDGNEIHFSFSKPVRTDIEI